VFFQPKFCNRIAKGIFSSQLETCEYTNCFYSCDKKQATVENADVLLFHQRDLEAELEIDYKNDVQAWLAATKQFPYRSLPEKQLKSKNSSQVWLLWNDESTFVTPQFNQLSSFFNWTMSYKTDAEVYQGSYGFFHTRNSDDINEVIKLKEQIYAGEFKMRQNAILWFVSNCKSRKRIEIALEISRHYPIHVYGNCDILGGMNVNDPISTYPYLKQVDIQCPQGSECEKKLFASFKYYLAFENRNCTDYITEKLWRSFDRRIIPIVLQPNRESYSHFNIPAGSIIHMQDFEYSTVKLTEYLKSMDSDFEAYYNILKWTNVYLKSFNSAEYLEPHRMCHLCKQLNTFKSNVYYKDLHKFFNGKCFD